LFIPCLQLDISNFQMENMSFFLNIYILDLYCSKMAQFGHCLLYAFLSQRFTTLWDFNLQSEKTIWECWDTCGKVFDSLGHYHSLMPFSYLNLNCEPKVKVMTKLMSTTPPILHVCYKISKHERWNSIKYPRIKLTNVK
jgi:hypothetical protein